MGFHEILPRKNQGKLSLRFPQDDTGGIRRFMGSISALRSVQDDTSACHSEEVRRRIC